MSWSIKFVGNYKGIQTELLSGVGQHSRDSGHLEIADSYRAARDLILTHLCQQTQAPEIGWSVEAWGGGASFHIDVQPCNLRVKVADDNQEREKQ